MLVRKDLDNKIFKHMDTWVENLPSIAWPIRDFYYRTIMATPGQSVFGREIILNITSVVDWRVVTAAKQRKVDIDTVR